MLINRRTLIALGVALSLATPAAAQADQDLRSPDTRDAAALSQDLRSPDARDAAAPSQDLRAPDVRDVANHYNPQPSDPIAASPARVTGTDWTMTLLAAAGYLLAVVAGAFAVRSRRRRRVAA